MTAVPSRQLGAHVRILVVALSLTLVAAACKPAEQTQVTGSQTTPPGSATGPGSAATPLPAALHELNETARTAKLTDAGLCSLDTMSGARVPSGQTTGLSTPSAAVFTGWLGDTTTSAWPQQPPAMRFDQADGGRAWEAGLGAPVPRKDVAKALHSDSMLSSGFNVPVDLSSLPAGEYTVRLVFDSANRRMSCGRNVRIRIGS